MNKLNGWDWTALVLVIVGGFNWGLVAFSQRYDLIALLTGSSSVVAARLIYGIIGLADIYLIFMVSQYARK
jgi:uncharacterized membrane protein YuzA (DUF378 family)